jgi:DNA-binding NarL/FixJ family response regulator
VPERYSSTGKEAPLTAVVADSHAATAEAVSLLLEAEPGISVVALASDRQSVARLVRQHRPSVLLLDTRMLDPGGAFQLPLLHEASLQTRVVLMGMQDAAAWRNAAERLGADGYLRKDSPLEGWLSAVRDDA